MNKEIKFTDKAIKQINHLLLQKDKGSFFRIAIKGGGCSGFQYDFSFDKTQEEDDVRFDNILITPKYQTFNIASYHLFIIRVNFKYLKCTKNEMIKYLNSKNIFPQFHYKPITEFKFFKKTGK